METIQITDDTGTPRSIPLANIYEHLARQDFKLYGMSLSIILQLRTEYQKLGGTEPMTDESVKEIFMRYGPAR